MRNIGRYMEPEGGPLSWYSTMKNIKDEGDRDFYSNTGRRPGSGILDKVKGLFEKAQGSPLRAPRPQKIQRPGLLGYNGLAGRGRSGFFKSVQDLFMRDQNRSVHARKDWHNFRHPEEGASRPGNITSAPQMERPGFIAGFGNTNTSVIPALVVLTLLFYFMTR